MAKQEYNKDQINELLSNPNVKSCSSKYITFNDDFKIIALDFDKNGVIPKEIFKKFGFPGYIINSEIPGRSLKRWRFKMKHKGISIFNETKKGRKKKEKYNISKMTKDEELEYLRTKVAVLEELKKLVDGGYP